MELKIYYAEFGLVEKLYMYGFNNTELAEQAFDMMKEEINEDIN